MNLAELQKEAHALTKENLKVLLMVHDRQEYLFQEGVITSIDDPVGVAPSYHAAAWRATKKGLLMGAGNSYRVSEAGKLALEEQYMNLTELQKEAHAIAVAHGWWDLGWDEEPPSATLSRWCIAN